YLDGFNRKKHFELDNLLITLKSKYQWPSILSNPPQKKYEFDVGLTVKGTINTPVSDKDKVTVMMSSPLYGINETAKLNTKNEFVFENVMAVDSAAIFFSLLDAKQRYTKLNMYTRLINPGRRFIKTF